MTEHPYGVFRGVLERNLPSNLGKSVKKEREEDVTVKEKALARPIFTTRKRDLVSLVKLLKIEANFLG